MCSDFREAQSQGGGPSAAKHQAARPQVAHITSNATLHPPRFHRTYSGEGPGSRQHHSIGIEAMDDEMQCPGPDNDLGSPPNEDSIIAVGSAKVCSCMLKHLYMHFCSSSFCILSTCLLTTWMLIARCKI